MPDVLIGGDWWWGGVVSWSSLRRIRSVDIPSLVADQFQELVKFGHFDNRANVG